MIMTALFMMSAPSNALDCSKATSDLDKAICADSELKEYDSQMEKTYFFLRKKLGPKGRAILLKTQRHWLKSRQDFSNPDSLSMEIEEHTRFLQAAPKGMVPVLSTRKTKNFTRRFQGYKFPDPSTKIQRTFNKHLQKILRSSISDPDVRGEEDVDASKVSRFDKFVLSTQVSTEGYYGGAHPSHNTLHINVDIKTGQILKIKTLFSKQALRTIELACAMQIAQDRPAYEKETPLETFKAFQEAYPNQITDHVKNSFRWQFKKIKTTISFNEYAIAPYVAGEQRCSFDNQFFAPLSKHPKFFK